MPRIHTHLTAHDPMRPRCCCRRTSTARPVAHSSMQVGSCRLVVQLTRAVLAPATMQHDLGLQPAGSVAVEPNTLARPQALKLLDQHTIMHHTSLAWNWEPIPVQAASLRKPSPPASTRCACLRLPTAVGASGSRRCPRTWRRGECPAWGSEQRRLWPGRAMHGGHCSYSGKSCQQCWAGEAVSGGHARPHLSSRLAGPGGH